MATSLRLLGDAPAAAHVSPAWAAKGFRPFFLLSAVFAAFIVPLWLLVLAGVVRADGHFDPISWHGHEMVFGFAVGVIAGFLLTAVANWTSRETAVGRPLMILSALWLAGRLALLAGPALPRAAVGGIDLAFLPALALTVGWPIFATRNSRNYPVFGMLTALWLANLAMHLDALGLAPGWRRRGNLAAVELVTLLILFMAARVFPMFTRNATGVETIRNLAKLDLATVASMLALTIADLLAPGHVAGTALAGATAVLAIARCATWGARHTLRQPLLWILHVGHAWIPVGLALRVVSALTPAVPASSALHALTAGAIGCTTLGMMARVALGHTGRPLVPSRAVTIAFLLIVLAAVVRVAGTLTSESYRSALYISGGLWTLAFALFVAAYAAILCRPRLDGKPG
ncbi:MAG: NnrS family protein [Deltaproteobacteria bacterium]|nr:NnrS family protein [Deltaproteobacteria bacterium]